MKTLGQYPNLKDSLLGQKKKSRGTEVIGEDVMEK